MRITQGCFSFLPVLPDEQIPRQVQYCLEQGGAVTIEFTDDPHPRNNFWEMWGLPMFDLRDAAGVMMELNECRKVYGERYIRLSAFDSSHGWESVRLSFIVNRPKRSEEHTSELQSQSNLVCRLLLEKKKNSACTCLPLPALQALPPPALPTAIIPPSVVVHHYLTQPTNHRRTPTGLSSRTLLS